MVCARWCPALPRPVGRSTMGAGVLSFRVRDGSGRVLPAMTTETSVGVCGALAHLGGVTGPLIGGGVRPSTVGGGGWWCL